jgi:hypothetical protein
MLCNYVLKRGVAKGKMCNNMSCQRHTNKIKINNDITKLPSLVLEKVVQSILNQHISYRDMFAKLNAISQTSIEFHTIITPLWKTLYNRLDISEEEETSMTRLTYLQRLHLLLEFGCQRCHKPRITKIYWPFPIRVCLDCIKKLTITRYELKTLYNVMNFQDDRYFVVNIYVRPSSSIIEPVYLRHYVEEILKCSLDSLIMNEHKKMISDHIGVPPSEILKFSKTYKSKTKPSINIVEFEYFRGLAISKMPFKRYFDGPIVQYRIDLMSIVDKESFMKWFSRFDQVISSQKAYEKRVLATMELGPR